MSIIGLAMMLGIVFIVRVHAQDVTSLIPSSGDIFTGDLTQVGTNFSSPASIIALIFNVIIAASAAIFIVMLLIGGIQYLTGAGNEESVGKAKKLLVNAIIGLFIVLAAWAIGTWILTRVGLIGSSSSGGGGGGGSGGGGTTHPSTVTISSFKAQNTSGQPLSGVELYVKNNTTGEMTLKTKSPSSQPFTIDYGSHYVEGYYNDNNVLASDPYFRCKQTLTFDQSGALTFTMTPNPTPGYSVSNPPSCKPSSTIAPPPSGGGGTPPPVDPPPGDSGGGGGGGTITVSSPQIFSGGTVAFRRTYSDTSTFETNLTNNAILCNAQGAASFTDTSTYSVTGSILSYIRSGTLDEMTCKTYTYRTTLFSVTFPKSDYASHHQSEVVFCNEANGRYKENRTDPYLDYYLCTP